MAKTVQNPSAIIEKIDQRLTVVRNLLSRTSSKNMTEELISGLEKIVGDIQGDVISVMQFAEDRSDDYMAMKREQGSRPDRLDAESAVLEARGKLSLLCDHLDKKAVRIPAEETHARSLAGGEFLMASDSLEAVQRLEAYIMQDVASGN